jgi:hypothetical protein
MASSVRTPTHLWIVGVLSLLWNCVGGVDYTMTQTRNEAWVSMMTVEQLAWFEAFPIWAEVAWALGVWGALLGSVLLLLRSRYAVHAFGVSLAGLAAATIFQRVVSPMPGEESPAMLGVQVLIWVIAIFLLYYAMQMRKRGVLR